MSTSTSTRDLSSVTPEDQGRLDKLEASDDSLALTQLLAIATTEAARRISLRRSQARTSRNKK